MLSDFLAILNIGMFLKIFIIKNLKNGVIFLSGILLCDVIAYSFSRLNEGEDYEDRFRYDNEMVNNFNSPLLF